jgi:type I restriction enzyme S subunit
MASNYKRLGDYIKVVREKNIDLKATKLLGINIDKFFMPSVANVIGTDMSNYKIVKHGQFACNRMHVGRDYRIPIALSREVNPFMVSPAYDVFEIIDTKVLLPEYLMMWFTRKEFDRNTWFHTDADVRGGLPWNAFCDLELPIPSPEKQQEIVREYHTIQNRITLNNQLISKLEETAQAIFNDTLKDKPSEEYMLKDLCSFQEGYVNPSKEHAKYFDGNIKWLRANDVNGGFILNTSRTLTEEGFNSAGTSRANSYFNTQNF